MTIRMVTSADAQDIALCLEPLGYATPASLIREKLLVLRNASSDAMWIYIDDGMGEAAGCVSLHAIPLWHESGMLARITALSVRTMYQRQGVGRALLATAQSWALAHGARRIEVTSDNHRENAHSFYMAQGYAPCSRRFIKGVLAPASR
ncbi:GNAT family N-acetyltransferase [Dyella sp.]|uniref:GNAT family N-acetyltransferase n=1 Tax=Dyella sp. TaxID=1869338 RepID=UPI002ED52649